MRVLAVETSCDETAVAVLESRETDGEASAVALGSALLSQVELHAPFGGVYPNLARREHEKNLVPMLKSALSEAGMLSASPAPRAAAEAAREVLAREKILAAAAVPFLAGTEPPDIDAVAVTNGPGLEPALWVGVNFAKALAAVWGKPLVPVNHMEGHVVSALLDETGGIRKIEFPAVALLISGGHTELALMEGPASWRILGETRDDAVGEAFDKTARMLGLPYPGGPAVSKLAEEARAGNIPSPVSLPRPMLDSGDLDFSFAGLKTAVRYALRDLGEISEDAKKGIAREFEDAVAEVLAEKTKEALSRARARTLLVGGGVSANREIRRVLASLAAPNGVELLLPRPELTTDNAVMIALAAVLKLRAGASLPPPEKIEADGNLRLA